MAKIGLTPNNVTYGCLIDACVKNGYIDKALSVFHQMDKDGVEKNTIIYTTLIKGFSKQYKLDKATEIFEKM